jgi:hypothetical protein
VASGGGRRTGVDVVASCLRAGGLWWGRAGRRAVVLPRLAVAHLARSREGCDPRPRDGERRRSMRVSCAGGRLRRRVGLTFFYHGVSVVTPPCVVCVLVFFKSCVPGLAVWAGLLGRWGPSGLMHHGGLVAKWLVFVA